jgi:hypothetical protein
MGDVPLRERRFRITISDVFQSNYEKLSFFLKQLLLRLGEKQTLSLWQKAFAINADDFLVRILSTDWQEISKDSNKSNGIETSGEYISDLFGSSIENVTEHAAKGLIEKSLPIPQIRQYFKSLNYEKHILGYEYLHLVDHSIALLAETTINKLGKQGELIIYDIVKEQMASRSRKPCSFTEYCGQCTSLLQSAEGNWLNCLIDAEIIKETDTELIFHVTQCDCARYFKDHHPTVGYLITCSTDESDAKLYNKNIRLQITSTIMEGGEICDFRYYLQQP